MQAARGTPLSDAPQEGGGRLGFLVSLAAGVLALDAVTKALAVDQLSGRDPVVVIEGVLSLRLVRNPGAAFGFAESMTIVLTCIAVVVIAAILRASRRLRSTGWVVALGFILGGALGNLGDRVFRRPGPLRGHVIDFLELPHWPVFNIADSAIVIGSVLLVVLSLRGIQHDTPPRRKGARSD